MHSLLIVFFLLFFSCSTINDVRNIPCEDAVVKNTKVLYYTGKSDFGYFDGIMLKNGFRRKKENEEFGFGLYGYADSKRKLLVTSDMEVLKTVLRFSAFSTTSFSFCASGPRPTPLLLKVSMDGKEIVCLTSEPFKITGTDNEFFSPGECGVKETEEGRVLGLHVEIKDIPSMDDVFVIDKAAYDKYCTPYNPNNRFMKINRDVLMEKYFTKSVTTGIYKFACVDEIHPQFSQKLSEKFKCEQILIDHKNNLDERPDFIYALIVKGIYFFMTEGGITILDLDHPNFKE